MDWFERLTGLSPDGGSGVYEIALIVLGAILAVGITGLRVRRLRAAPRRQDCGD